MKKIYSLFAVLLVLTLAMPTAKAQILERNDLFYNSSILPQANRLNPGIFQSNRSAYITLPYYDITLGLPIAYSDLRFVKDKNKYKLDLNALADNLQNDQSLHIGTDVSLIGFGMHIKRFFLTFDASASVTSSLYFPQGLSYIFTDGLLTSIGYDNRASVAFNNLVSATAYERFALAVGYDITDNFSLGLRFNLLNGVANATIDDVDIAVWSEDDAYSTIKGSLDYNFLRAGQLAFDFDESEFSFNHSFNNIGYTFDLGAVVHLGKVSLSASVVDLGPGIKWSENTRRITPKHNDISFSGSEISGLLTSGDFDTDFFNSYDDVSDTLSAMLDYVESDADAYWQAIPTKVFLGATYTFNQTFRANLLFHGEYDNGILKMKDNSMSFGMDGTHFRYNLSLSGSVKANNFVELMVANAFCFDGEKGSFFNPAFGLTLAPGNAVQLFFLADYISSFKAVDMKGTHFQFGVNICFGRDRTKSASSSNVVSGSDVPIL